NARGPEAGELARRTRPPCRHCAAPPSCEMSSSWPRWYVLERTLSWKETSLLSWGHPGTQLPAGPPDMPTIHSSAHGRLLFSPGAPTDTLLLAGPPDMPTIHSSAHWRLLFSPGALLAHSCQQGFLICPDHPQLCSLEASLLSWCPPGTLLPTRL
ncbi:hypothetical protein NDU88_012852, partial [Pleurodeles waltl]